MFKIDSKKLDAVINRMRRMSPKELKQHIDETGDEIKNFGKILRGCIDTRTPLPKKTSSKASKVQYNLRSWATYLIRAEKHAPKLKDFISIKVLREDLEEAHNLIETLKKGYKT